MAKILLLTTGLDIGGRERLIVDLANYLVKLDNQITICCINRSGLLSNLVDKKIEITELNKKNSLDLSVVSPLKNFLVDRKIEILHSHNPGTLLYGLLSAKWAGTPVIINTEHGLSNSLSPKALFKNRLIYKFVDYTTTVSKILENDLISSYKINKRKLSTIRNGIYSADINQNPFESKIKIGMKPYDFNIGIAARLVPVKNHRMLIYAFSKVKKEFKYVRLWIIGSGELRSELEQQSKELGLNEDVVFMGERSDIPVILNALDLFVLSSLSEGLSITLLEAMSIGLPIIATRVGGNPEVIKHNKSGLLVESDKPDELAAAIIMLIKNKELRVKFGIEARRRYDTDFQIDNMAVKMTNLYQRLLSVKYGK